MTTGIDKLITDRVEKALTTIDIDKLVSDRVEKELAGVKNELNQEMKTVKKELKQEVNKQLKKQKKSVPVKQKEITDKPEPTTIEKKELELIEVTFLNLQKEAEKNNEAQDIMNKERLDKVVAYNLKRIRTENGLSQKAVTDMCGMKYATYASIEQGRGFSLESIFIIANGLGLTPSDILTTN